MFMGRSRPFRFAGPKAHGVRTEFRRDIYSSLEEVETLITPRYGAKESRLMFASRVEQKAGAGLDHRAQRMFFQQRLHVCELAREDRVDGNKRVEIKRQGDTAISQLR